MFLGIYQGNSKIKIKNDLGGIKMNKETQMITRPLETIEGEILFYKQQTATGIMEIGKRLIEAKEQLPHGTWGTWLKEKVEFSHATANKFMKVANEFSNSSTLRNLGQSKIFMLLDLQLDDRDEFMTTPHEVNGEVKTVDEMSARELQQAIKEKKEAEKQVEVLKQALEDEKSKPKEKEIVDNPVIVDNTDYSLKTEAERLKKEKEDLLREYTMFKQTQEAEKDRLNKQLAIEKQRVENGKQQLALEKQKVEIEKERNEFLENAQKEYNDLKLGIELLTEQKDSISRQVSTGTELSGLIVNIQSFIKEELSPIAYSRALREASTCDVVQENLRDIVGVVRTWCNEMDTYLISNNTNDEIVFVEGVVIE